MYIYTYRIRIKLKQLNYRNAFSSYCDVEHFNITVEISVVTLFLLLVKISSPYFEAQSSRCVSLYSSGFIFQWYFVQKIKTSDSLCAFIQSFSATWLNRKHLWEEMYLWTVCVDNQNKVQRCYILLISRKYVVKRALFWISQFYVSCGWQWLLFFFIFIL